MSKKLNESKKILIAAYSSTVCAVISSICSDNGYECIVVRDGESALSKLVEEQIDCLIVGSGLPVLDPYQLSRIVKNNVSLSAIPIILCVSEINTEVEYASSAVGINELYQFDSVNPESICDCIQKCLDASDFQKSVCQEDDTTSTVANSKSLLSMTASAFEENRFESELIKEVFSIGVTNQDVVQMARKLLQLLAGICSYDVASIILNGSPIRQIDCSIEGLTQRELDDFHAVCHNDYKKKFPGLKSYDYTTDTSSIQPHFSQKQVNDRRIQSYECITFSDCGVDFGTLHIGHSSMDRFKGKTLSRLEFFVEKASVILNKVLLLEKTTSDAKKMRT